MKIGLVPVTEYAFGIDILREGGAESQLRALALGAAAQTLFSNFLQVQRSEVPDDLRGSVWALWETTTTADATATIARMQSREQQKDRHGRLLSFICEQTNTGPSVVGFVLSRGGVTCEEAPRGVRPRRSRDWTAFGDIPSCTEAFIWVSPEHRNRGIGTETAQVLAAGAELRLLGDITQPDPAAIRLIKRFTRPVPA